MLLTGIYFNLQISLLAGGGPIVSCFTQKDGGHSEVQGLAQGLSRQDLCIWGAKESGYPHLFHSAGDGVPPAQWRNSDSRPGPQHREDTHTAFFTRWELTTDLFQMPWRNVQYNIK